MKHSLFGRHAELKSSALNRQASLLSVVGPLATPSLATLAAAAAERAVRKRGFSQAEFGFGAEALVSAMASTAAARDEFILSRSFSLDCLYSALVGALSVAVHDPDSADRIDRWLESLVRVCIGDEIPGGQRLIRAQEVLAGALLLSVYALPVAATEVADVLRLRIQLIVGQIAADPPGLGRERLVAAVMPAATALAGGSEPALMAKVVERLGPEIREHLRRRSALQFTPPTPMLGIPRPRYIGDHQGEEAVARLREVVEAISHRGASGGTEGKSRRRGRPKQREPVPNPDASVRSNERDRDANT